MINMEHFPIIFSFCFVALLLSDLTEAYDSCWDGVNAVDYTGIISVTQSGLTCQAWATDSPHTHLFHGGSPLFPHDGDDVAASNYCRDPDGTSGTNGPWCYTMNPAVPAEYCAIPRCFNLPCVSGAIAGALNPSLFVKYLDAYTNINYLMQDAAYRITCCGTISEWRVYAGVATSVHFQVWRNVAGNFELIGENAVNLPQGLVIHTVPQADRISVQEDDYIGWFNLADTVAYTDTPGTTMGTALLFGVTTAPTVGSVVDFTPASIGDVRDYAVGAVIANSLPPYFTSTDTAMTITTAYGVSSTIYTLLYTDDDTMDVSTLTVAMDTNTYFELSGSDVVVKTALVVSVQTLTFTVKDRCTLTGVHTMNVTINPQVVNITSLPAIETVSESLTVQTLVHTLTFDPTGVYACTLDSYTPTRAEGNPFVYLSTPTIGIYLKAAAAIRYSVTTSYNVTITCTSVTSDTSYLIINVDPNAAPVFASFQASATLSATTAVATTVYTATVTDAESDPIVMTLTCDPTPCPFVINNNGEITVTGDVQAVGHSSYTWIMTAYDGFNTVTSSNVSVIITDMSITPVITNLGVTATVLENAASMTSVYQVSQTDANVGDVPTFSATFAVTACAAMYDINNADGTVSTLVSLDFETDPQCVMVVTVFDGIATSAPGTLTIDVIDVDEPPVWSDSGYVITTEEVASGTALPAPTSPITATDPEGSAVSYTINCGTDSGYLTIDPATAIVTMATSYDLETAGVDTYTISCTVTATDATAQTSTVPLDVTVTDGNDVAPVLSSGSYSFYTQEGMTGTQIIGTVLATDADRTSPNNDVTYSITPTTDFTVGGDGSITNVGDLSAVASGTTYTLTLTATDGGTPPLTDTVTVTVTVLSVVTTTASSATSASVSGSTSFFDDIGNIILLAVACLTALLLMIALGCLTYRCCKGSDGSGAVMRHNEAPMKGNSTRHGAKDMPKTMNNNNISSTYQHPMPQVYSISNEAYKPIGNRDKPPAYKPPLQVKPGENKPHDAPRNKPTLTQEPRRVSPEFQSSVNKYERPLSTGMSSDSLPKDRMFKHSQLDKFQSTSPSNVSLRMTKSKFLNRF